MKAWLECRSRSRHQVRCRSGGHSSWKIIHCTKNCWLGLIVEHKPPPGWRPVWLSQSVINYWIHLRTDGLARLSKIPLDTSSHQAEALVMVVVRDELFPHHARLRCQVTDRPGNHDGHDMAWIYRRLPGIFENLSTCTAMLLPPGSSPGDNRIQYTRFSLFISSGLMIFWALMVKLTVHHLVESCVIMPELMPVK